MQKRRETVEEFLARGGKIEHPRPRDYDPGEAWGMRGVEQRKEEGRAHEDN